MQTRERRAVRFVTARVVGVAVLAVSLSACRHESVHESIPERAATPRTYQLVVSSSSDRSGAMALSGRRLRGRVYVFVPSDAEVARVWFYLDGSPPSRSPSHTRESGPFDLAGSRPDGAARPFDTTVLSNGRHTITAVLDLSDGRTSTARAWFAVFNPAKPSTTTGTTTTTTVATATREPEPATPRLLFGLGPEANGARSARLTQQTPVRMLTSWYNGPGDLAWMVGWRDSLVPQAYAAGYAMHLIVWTGDAEGSISTPYGTACGRRYPLSSRFPDDMRRLAGIFAGAAKGPPLYVSLFTEFQTYPCKDNAWNADSEANAYYRTLKDRYRDAMATFHRQAPNARVSLSWGGWQTRWDDPATGGGRSLFRYFSDVLRASDFQSFQAMATDSNVRDIRAMVRTLGPYGPVMLAHYKPDNGSTAVVRADLHAVLSDEYLARATRDGLFAMSFMDAASLTTSSDLYDFVRRAVRRYARAPG